MNETAANMTLFLLSLAGLFVTVHNEIPEIKGMNITFVNLKNETIGEAYCLGEWVDEVRMDGDMDGRG